MLERRTLYDDSRGMGEGIVDNRKTVNKFWLLLEEINHATPSKDAQNNNRFENGEDTPEKGDVLRNFNLPTNPGENPSVKQDSFVRPSLYANQLSNSLNYPVGVFILEANIGTQILSELNILKGKFPCDLHLMTLRTQPDSLYSQFPTNSALMVLHRQGYDCLITTDYICNATKFKPETELKLIKVKQFQQTTLTGLDEIGDSFEGLADVYVKPMGLRTFNVTFG